MHPPLLKAKTKSASQFQSWLNIFQNNLQDLKHITCNATITLFCRFVWYGNSVSAHSMWNVPPPRQEKWVRCDNNMCTYSHLAIWLILRSSLWQPGFTVLLHGSIRHSTLFSGRQSPETTTKITGYQTNINLSGNFVSSILIGFVWKKEAHLKPLHIYFLYWPQGENCISVQRRRINYIEKHNQ